jgi:hypothetical protein
MNFPKLNLVTLRAGTKFYGCLPDGTISAERVLTEDTQVELVCSTDTYNVYDTADGLTFMVKKTDEVR